MRTYPPSRIISFMVIACGVFLAFLGGCSESETPSNALGGAPPIGQETSTFSETTPPGQMVAHQGGHSNLWNSQTNSQCPDSMTGNISQVLGVLIDRSGSVNSLAGVIPSIVSDTGSMVQQVPPGTLVVVHYVSDPSFSDHESVYVGMIPDIGTEDVCLAADLNLQEKRECQRLQKIHNARVACLTETRKRMILEIAQLNPPPSPKTDLMGGIAALEEIFRVYPQASRTLVLYTDLADTEGLQLPRQMDGMQGATVWVRYPRHVQATGKNVLQKFEQMKIEVKNLFLSRGVKRVQPIPLSVPITLQPF